MTNIMVKGRMGKEPMVRTTKTGSLMAVGSLAVKPVSRALDAPTLWFSLVAWEQVAEHLGHYRKGQTVVVSGRLGYDTWHKDPSRGEWTITVARIHDASSMDRLGDDFVEEVDDE